MNVVRVTRTHEIACGHRVHGHEGKCAGLHGHNYRFEITCEADALDALGRVIDFAILKSTLCEWLEANWDHKMLLWEGDPICMHVAALQAGPVVLLPVNPTAENLAAYFGTFVALEQLRGTGVRCTRVVVWETSKCSATWEQR